MTPDIYGGIYADTSDEGAKIGLLMLMYGISEEYWCAAWMSGLEDRLWEARSKPEGMSYGQGFVSPRQVSLLRLLSEEADGWWRWSEERGNPEFVRMEEWERIRERV